MLVSCQVQQPSFWQQALEEGVQACFISAGLWHECLITVAASSLAQQRVFGACPYAVMFLTLVRVARHACSCLFIMLPYNTLAVSLLCSSAVDAFMLPQPDAATA